MLNDAPLASPHPATRQLIADAEAPYVRNRASSTFRPYFAVDAALCERLVECRFEFQVTPV
jgi:hypothetical protein